MQDGVHENSLLCFGDPTLFVPTRKVCLAFTIKLSLVFFSVDYFINFKCWDSRCFYFLVLNIEKKSACKYLFNKNVILPFTMYHIWKEYRKLNRIFSFF